MLDSDFGHWLAGFIDGEGCFVIHSNGKGLKCRFGIWLREDDRLILEEIQKKTGIGKIVTITQKPGKNAQVMWQVQSRPDCLCLMHLLTIHPLRAKKARDFELWKEALLTWARVQRGNDRTINLPLWDRMHELKVEMQNGRRYRVSA